MKEEYQCSRSNRNDNAKPKFRSISRPSHLLTLAPNRLNLTGCVVFVFSQNRLFLRDGWSDFFRRILVFVQLTGNHHGVFQILRKYEGPRFVR